MRTYQEWLVAEGFVDSSAGQMWASITEPSRRDNVHDMGGKNARSSLNTADYRIRKEVPMAGIPPKEALQIRDWMNKVSATGRQFPPETQVYIRKLAKLWFMVDQNAKSGGWDLRKM